MQNDCIVCGNKTPVVDEAWGVALCGKCALDVMVPLVGRALVLDSPNTQPALGRGQLLGRLRDAIGGAQRDLAAGAPM